MESAELQSPEDRSGQSIELTDELIDRALTSRTPKPLALGPATGKRGPEVQVFDIGIVSISVEPFELANKKIKVNVRLCGVPVGDFVLTEGAFEQSVGPNIGIAKAFVTLSVNWGEQKLTYACKACMRNLLGKWKCKSNSGVLATW